MASFKKHLLLSLFIVLGILSFLKLDVSANTGTLENNSSEMDDAAFYEAFEEAVGAIRALADEEGVGLAGIYQDDSNVLNIVLAGTDEEVASDTEAIKEKIPAGIEVAFHKASYEIKTLKLIQKSLRNHYSRENSGLVGSGIDEINNRVYLEVINLTSEKKTAILNLIPDNLPKEAVVFRDLGPPAAEEATTGGERGEFANTGRNVPKMWLIGGLLVTAGIVLIFRRKKSRSR